MKATIRKDLMESNQGIPVIDIRNDSEMYIYGDKQYESYQPTVLDNNEYNTILSTDDGDLFLSSSIDLDFIL